MLVTITRVINWSILFAFIACFSYQIVYLIAPYIKKEKRRRMSWEMYRFYYVSMLVHPVRQS